METIHGASLSPFVRKVVTYYEERGLPYDLKMAIPHSDDPDFQRMSPLGRIPVFSDGEVELADSSVILGYLEKKHSGGLYPENPADYAKALWIEEYCDTRAFEALVAKVFFERKMKIILIGKPCDEAVVARALEEDVPEVCGYLEGIVGDRAFVVGDRISIADLCIATNVVNFQYAGESIDAERFPKLSAYLERILARPSFQKVMQMDAEAMANMPS